MRSSEEGGQGAWFCSPAFPLADTQQQYSPIFITPCEDTQEEDMVSGFRKQQEQWGMCAGRTPLGEALKAMCVCCNNF